MTAQRFGNGFGSLSVLLGMADEKAGYLFSSSLFVVPDVPGGAPHGEWRGDQVEKHP
jgi:hypothetical protein